MNGRIYDPLLGRFLSADTVVQFPGNLQSFNRYSYVHNNPLTYTDPSGHFLPFLVLPLLGGLTVGETVAASGALAVGTVAATPEGQSAIKQGLTKIGEAISEAAGSVANFFATMHAVPGGGVKDPWAQAGLQWQFIFENAGSSSAPAQSNNGQQAAGSAATTPKEPAEQGGETAKPKENSSGGQVSQEPPNDDQNGGSSKPQREQKNERQTSPQNTDDHESNYQEPPERQSKGRGKDQVREKTAGANRADRKQIDDVARRAGVDRREFGDLVEQEKAKQGRGGSDNFTYKQLEELAKRLKEQQEQNRKK